MFDNIGGKIKGVAAAVCWLGIIISIIVGIDLCASDEEVLTVVGIVVIFLGSLSSWIGSFVLYGFGQLVENSDKLVKGRVTEQFQPAPKAAKPMAKEALAKLETLNRWKEQNLITADEYEQKVRELQ